MPASLPTWLRRAWLPGLLLLPIPAQAATAHGDPSAPIVLTLGLVLVGALLVGHLATRLRQPPVLGELLLGVLVSALGLPAAELLRHDPAIDVLARLGVLVLLFQVGLESTVRQMLAVGVRALLVAVVGVAAPFGLGWLVAAWLLPTASVWVHVFIGATLTATSVGITARVLKDLDSLHTREARIILGAAVIDDVLGLIVLAVVTGLVAAADGGQSVGLPEIAWIVGKAGGFLIGALALGVWLAPRGLHLASRLQVHGALVGAGLALCFLLSWAADAVGLAAIVGAFAAGLVLEDVHYADFTARGERTLDELIRPIASLLVPLFFVVVGARIDLRQLLRPEVLGLAGALLVVGIVGKQACSLVAGPETDRLTVGLGMIPRGEVGLLFASIGQGLQLGGQPLVSDALYAAIVAMVLGTTVLTPPLLGSRLRRLQSSRTDGQSA